MPLHHTVRPLTLKNGAKGILIDIPNTSVFCYELCFRAGNEFVRRKGIQQTAHILEHMSFQGCKRYPTADALSREFTKNGAYNNATTGQTSMTYYGDCAQMEWDRVLDIQLQALAEPIYTEQSLAVEKQNVLSELNGNCANHGRLLWQAIGRSLGDKALSDAQKIATIDAVTLDDILEHYRRTHTLKNLRFAIGGPLAGNETRLQQMLEDWQLRAGSGHLAPRQVTLKNGAPVSIMKEERQDILFGLSIGLHRRLSHRENNAMAALNHILTGTFHSNIFGKARDRGLSYSVGSSITEHIDGNAEWTFGGQVNHEHIDALLQLMTNELQRVIDGTLDEKVVDESIQFGLGTFEKSHQTVSELVGSYASDYFFDETVELLDDIPGLIRSTSAHDIIAMAREFIRDGVWCYGEIGKVTEPETQARSQILAPLFGGRT